MTAPTKKQWITLIRSLMPKLFGKQKLLLAFEYGLTISETAREMKIELTPEIVDRAENILLDSCRNESAETVAIEMIPNILAIFEPKE
jgi:hypothetical protein